ncbi:MAG: cobalamin-dependent protein [Sedimenticola sp.]|nr:cobalamin-dependent protein [Sedimenticola sp.]
MSAEQSNHFPAINKPHLLDAIINAYRLQQPEPFQRGGAAFEQKCREDIAYHLDYLNMAADADAPEIFAEYSRWLRDVLNSRNVPARCVAFSYELLQTHFTNHHPEESVLLGKILEAGIQAINHDKLPQLAQPLPANALEAENFSLLISQGAREQSRNLYFDKLKQSPSLAQANLDLLQPSLYEVGRRWQINQISVAQEHMATAICQSLMAQGFGKVPFAASNGKRAVFAAVEGAQHALGIQMIADGFEEAGWACDFIGANTPLADLLVYLDQEKPDLLGLSATLPVDIAQAKQMTTQIRAELGNCCPVIMVGGLATNYLPRSWELTGADIWAINAVEAIKESK